MNALRTCLLCLALSAAACGKPTYAVSTCAFDGHAGDCTPVSTGEDGAVDYHFSVINPAAMRPGCAGELELRIGDGRLQYSAQELDPDLCVAVGDELEGTSDVRPRAVVDVYYPRQGFTFRVEVDER